MGGEALNLSDDDVYSLVDDWRRSSPNIVKFWGDVQSVAVKVITDQSSLTLDRLKFSYESGIFFIELPSGRRLAYVRPKVEKDGNGRTIITYEGVGENKKWMRLDTYGPKLVENITQGIARDLLLHAMMALQDMAIVAHVHDEVIVECAADVPVEQVCHLMEQPPEWADGLLLRADGYECEFYMKQ
jgi:DNA polymerase